MCGILGVINKNEPVKRDLFEKMLSCIKHRGPDDKGVWFDNTSNVALGHQRLSIIDLSPGGHQPMISEDGRFVLTYNGEIYNYKKIKEELVDLGFKFRSESDTEVLLYAYSAWGKECLQKLNGMFAFAIWDNLDKSLFAARDRVGEKPFKYYFDDEKFIFASELKAIIEDPSVRRVPDWQAVDLALTYRYVPAPLTGFKNIYKLPAGHYLYWKDGDFKTESYWQAEDFAIENNDRSLNEWKVVLWDTFRDSVRGRMISDVPVGVFLSGGLDSSSVVAAMHEFSPGKIKTFSVGLKGNKNSETPFAKIVADRFKTDHTEIFIEPNIIEIIPKLVHQYEEPFFDNAAVPTMVMAEKTRKNVTVALTGDGADECFGGYTNHIFFKRLSIYQNVPPFLREKLFPLLAKSLSEMTRNKYHRKLFYRSEVLGHELYQSYVDYYAIWKKELGKSNFYLTKEDLYTDELKQKIDLNKSEEMMKKWMGVERVKKYGDINRAMLADIVGRMGDNYLMKVDFAGMTYGLENRAPFLDHNLVELALSLPEKYKVKGNVGKWVWKEIMQGKLPDEIIHRRKMGFGIPIDSWMREELYEYVRENLLQNNSKLYDHFKKDIVIKMIEDHKNGLADYSNHLWCLLLLDNWLKTFFSYE